MVQKNEQLRSVRLAALGLAITGGLVLSGCRRTPPQGLTTVWAAQEAPKRVPVTVPAVKKHLYPEVAEAPADIRKAIAQAHREHKRVILDFGGDWCGDCQVLDIYFNQQPNAQLLSKYFVKVNVNIGHEDANVDIAKKYGVPLVGVPALAVLDSNGKTLYSQSKEFSDMRYMESTSVTEFLNKWKH